MSDRPEFLFVTCHTGAESALKNEIARSWPNFRFSFSRPGFLTFKLPADQDFLADFDLRSTFAQTWGFSLGRVSGDTLASRVAQFWGLVGPRPVRALHVWQRELFSADDTRPDPAISEQALESRQAIRNAAPEFVRPTLSEGAMQRAAHGDPVVDCVVVEPDQWWVGYHLAGGICSGYPGGLLPVTPPVPPVSRAWYKLEEALTWSALPVPPASRFADLGCAPGGASQALLQRGHSVLGVDPAEVSPTVLQHPNFRHIRRRVS
ncbi:MAG: SAM-dependent methyltransferase, partial [Thermoguttaceae bacterium]